MTPRQWLPNIFQAAEPFSRWGLLHESNTENKQCSSARGGPGQGQPQPAESCWLRDTRQENHKLILLQRGVPSLGLQYLALLHCNSTQRGPELENTVFWKVLKSMNSLCSFCLCLQKPQKHSEVEHIICNLIFKHKLLSLNSFTFIKQWIGQFFKEMAEIWIEGEKSEVGTVTILPLGNRKKQIAWYILFLNFLTSISWLLLSNGTEHSVKKLTGSPSLSKLSRKYFTDSP